MRSWQTWVGTLLAVALLLAAAASSWAASQARVLFGEEQFERTGGSPDISERSFTIPSYVSAPYTLRIINGDPEGSRGKAIEGAVSSGRILIDGIEVVSPKEFSKTVATIEKLLSLEPDAHDGPHRLEVRLASAPVSFIRLTIEGTINLGNLAAARAGHAGTLTADGRVLITGGTGVTGVLDTAEVFDPVTLTSSQLASTLTTPRTEHTATPLPRAETLLVAGEDTAGSLFTTEVFHPTDSAFTEIAPEIQPPRSGHTATGLLDGRVVILGGLAASNLALADAEVFDPVPDPLSALLYDPDTGIFTSLPNALREARSDHSVTLLPDGLLLVVGGRNDQGELASAELFDPATGTSTPLTATLTVPRAGHAATRMPDGTVVISGGTTGGTLLDSIEVYDPVAQTFTPLATTLLVPRTNHTGNLLPIGEILIAGGEGPSGPLAHTELVGPPAAETLVPLVQAVSPPDLAAPVALNALVALQFSEPLDVATVTAATLTLSGPAGSVASVVGPGEGGLLAFVVPQALLAVGTTFTVEATGLKDLAGNALPTFTSTFTTVAAPSIASFSPESGAVGTVVTIAGENFTPELATPIVKFNGIPAEVTDALATSLTAVVPTGATTGPTTVTAAGGIATSAADFVVLVPPVIENFTPTQGSVGTAVTLTGQNFAPVGAENQVAFNGVAATVISATATTISTSVPAGATTGPITVTTDGGTDTSATNFIVLAGPTINSFTPTTGRLGDLVTITGTGFDPTLSNNQVTIGGAAAPVQSATATQLIVSVPVAAVTGLIAVTTAGGTAQTTANFTVTAVAALVVTPENATLPIGAGQPFRATATFADQTTGEVTSFVTWTSANTAIATVNADGLATGVAPGDVLITGTLGALSDPGTVRVVDDPGVGGLPPDPASVAPPVDPTVSTTMLDATAFLYTGVGPIQSSVAPGTIELVRAAVVRGTVRDRAGFPIPGITVTILDHPEFGQTLTRPDGMFDLAVNGGGPLTVSYKRAGFIPAQRQVHVPWQDYVVAPDVVMIPRDPNVATVDLASATTIQVARGSVVTDSDGTRQATLLFTPGMQATMTLPDGTTQPLTTLHVRATEFTVGDTGPQAMPAELPPTSAYTYAVEYSVDEAIAADAQSVTFSVPVISYNEDFLGMPIGTPVPTGFYDASRGQWVAVDSGRVIEIVSETAGLADLDIDAVPGADSAAALAQIGITDDERGTLATLYDPGARLWRVQLPHLSAWDMNFAGFEFTIFVAEAEPRPTQQPPSEPTIPDPCKQEGGSVLQCENQTLGEMVPVVGTPFQVHYSSDRVRGRRENFSLEIPLTDNDPPLSMKRIDLDITVAGRAFHFEFGNAPNLSFTFTWDGRDAYGRPVQGRQLATGVLGYAYDGLSYGRAARFGRGVSGVTGGGDGGAAQLVPARGEAIFTQRWQVPIGAWVPPDLGGWSLNVHHAYDLGSRTLHLGNGDRRSAEGTGQIVETVAGTGTPSFSGDGGPATSAQLNSPQMAAMAADGSLYIADTSNARVRRISPDGIVTTIGGGGADSTSEGIPATQAQLGQINALALGPDGSVYVGEGAFTRVRRIDPDGTIRTVAGNLGQGCFTDFSGTVIICGATEVPATDPSVRIGRAGFLLGLAVAPDGSLYIADNFASRVWAVTPDGIISRFAGAIGAPVSTLPLNEGGSATEARVRRPVDVAVGPDGSVYISVLAHRVRKVGVDGRISTVAGTGALGFNGDGIPATAAQLNSPQGIAVADDGTLYITDIGNRRIRRVDPAGIITTVAWDGTTQGFAGDGGLARRAAFGGFFMFGLDVGPDGSVLIPDALNHRVRQLVPPFRGLEPGDLIVPADDGSELYVFTTFGRHLRTLDALTGATRLTFNYDPTTGLLNTVVDADANMTTIERDGAGNPSAIVAPGGQRTDLTLNANSFIASIANPAEETVQLTYSAEGLLETLTDPRGNLTQFTYDALGRLVRDEDAAAGFLAFSRTDQGDDWEVVQTTAENRATTYTVDRLSNGDRRRTVTAASGLTTTSVKRRDGTTTLTAPDGTVTTSVDGPDPRWGMQAPLLSSLEVSTPGGLTSTLSTARSITLSNPEDPLSLATQTDTLVINGRTYTSAFDQTARLVTTTTPAGRTSQVALDAHGRVVQEQVPGLEAVSYT